MELNKPNPFKPNKNQIGRDWQIWKKEFLIYLRLSGCYEKCKEEERALILVNLMGTEGVRAMEEMTFDDPDDKDDMDILIDKFDQIFDPPLNEAEERYKFFSRRIRANENIDNYVTDLKTRASTCNFGSQYEKFIIDTLVRDMDSYIRDVVFALGDVTLIEVIQYYKQFNINNDKIKELTRNAVASKTKTSDDTENSNNTQAKSMQPKFCWKCSSRHVYGSCPAYGNICNVCNQKNHFNGICRKQTKNNEKEEKNICTKCRTYHPFKQCPTYDNTKEENKRICSKCGTNHPYRQCPAYDNTKEETKRICSKCGTNHPFRQCPAFDKTCGKCSTKGHYTQQCKEKKNDDAVNQNTNTTRSSDNKAQKPSDTKLEDCSWCELKHVKDLCPHPASCVRCDTFPHNVCFKCKKNPHEPYCQYRTVITLPSLNKQSDVQNCKNCGTCHGNSPCNSLLLYCNQCKSHGHLATNCFLFAKQNNNPAHSNTSDPLLRDYVRVENARQPSSSSANNQRPTSSTSRTNYPNNLNYPIPTPSSSTFNTNYSNSTNRQNPAASTHSMPGRNEPHKSRSDFKKQNQKSDCTIS